MLDDPQGQVAVGWALAALQRFSYRGCVWTRSRALLVMMNESRIEAQPELRPVVAADDRSALAWFGRHIAAGIARGEISPDNDPATNALLLGTMRGVMLQWLVDPMLPVNAVRHWPAAGCRAPSRPTHHLRQPGADASWMTCMYLPCPLQVATAHTLFWIKCFLTFI